LAGEGDGKALEPGERQSRTSSLRLHAQAKSLFASERDELERERWRQDLPSLADARLVFVDESSTHLAFTPAFARSRRGTRARGSAPRNRGRNLSLLAALTAAGPSEAALVVEGPVDSNVFLVFVREVLVPSLEAGSIVVMDNLNVHKRPLVRELIEGAGCRLLFLPKYSPDLNPIEQAFSKVKSFPKRVGARTREVLLDAIALALASVTVADVLGWFQHCGHQPSTQHI
jgi:transposase